MSPRRFAPAAALLCLWAGLAAAAPGPWEQEVAEAARAVTAAESGGLSVRLAAMTRLIAAQEDGQAQLRTRLALLGAEEEKLASGLAQEEDRTARLLAALERLGDAEAPLPLLHPQGALAAARAATMTGDVVAALSAERAALSARLDHVQGLRQAAQDASARLDALRDETAAARQAMIDAAAQGRPLPAAFDSESAAAQAAALGISDLTGLGARLGPERPSGAAPSDLPLPVEALPVAEGDGWRMKAGYGTLVSAPAAGHVLYAGPLRGHRLVMVIELAPGRTLSLAGLGRVLLRSGDPVAPGQPLGFLPDAPPAAMAAQESHGNVTPAPFTSGDLPGDTLYMETRDANRPADPALWFAAEEDKRPK
ncbi:murein hydrolase activator EnvC family protein [Mangrovicoccus algicola]|uniref:Peptidoglycan DD-metalloendopeptidase family protein n=1 Tax=Mangrovicoccus algicola TaxID=2771008 RepID=A0A8J6Z8C5_9RHOB|nr:peptidoglycan DD-metalloendopeptidase family protein [Mangrovicoccus algicola]MBE3639774.1 peptidoglycan DD-metalloendopeptidase family protein [Mangrovicoccus algicola]